MWVITHTHNARYIGVSFERAIKWHRWAARVSLCLVIVHLLLTVSERGSGLLFSFDSALTPRGLGPAFGTLGLVVMAVSASLALEPIRRRCVSFSWNFGVSTVNGYYSPLQV